MIPTPRALLLDLDDTLIDYGGSAAACWRTLCGFVAAETPGLDADSLYQTIDHVRAWYWGDPERHRIGRADLQAASCWIVAEAMRRQGHDERLAPVLSERYRQMRWDSMTIIPGVLELLGKWRTAGLRLALVTNGTSADQRAKIERFGLLPFFDHIQIEGEFGYGKPEPQVYAAALAGVDCAAAEAWFVGDNLEWDVAAPQRAGICGVWVNASGEGVPSDSKVQPDRIIRSVVELESECPAVPIAPKPA